MFCNVKNYAKILKIAYSCKTKSHVKLTYDFANQFRSNFGLTEFEYLAIEKTLLNILKVDDRSSRWNNHIDIESLLQKSIIAD